MHISWYMYAYIDIHTFHHCANEFLATYQKGEGETSSGNRRHQRSVRGSRACAGGKEAASIVAPVWARLKDNTHTHTHIELHAHICMHVYLC